MRTLVVIAVALWTLGAAFAPKPGIAAEADVEVQPVPRLRFNPFEAQDEGATRDTGARDRAASRSDIWEPVLRATLSAGPQSFANLGGIVLAIGQEIHGYKLLEVREYEAVFQRNGERIELEIAPPAGLAPERSR